MFNPLEWTSLRIHQPDVHPTGIVCTYTLHGSNATTRTFTETLDLPATDTPSTPARTAALVRLAHLYALAASPSYYKTCTPGRVDVEFAVTPQQRTWLHSLLTSGLGEFAYRNALPNVLNGPDIDTTEDHQPQTLDLPPTRGPLVPVGGGKDSIVSIETLRKHRPVLFSVGAARPIVDTADVAQLPHLIVTRTLDPQLRQLNTTGAYNGHVPVTAAVSLIALIVAAHTGSNAVALSAERSASEGNLHWNGHEINHQWSKSLTAEQQLRQAVHSAGLEPDQLDYFSLLRPLSELDIARRFAQHRTYHPVFTSCNAAFRLDPARRLDRWCGNCPKCQFVTLILAPFLTRRELVDIVGRDVLDDPAQIAAVGQLVGLGSEPKPFECVGELDECRVALLDAAARPEWAGARSISAYRDDLLSSGFHLQNARQAAFTAGTDHFLPDWAQEALDASR